MARPAFVKNVPASSALCGEHAPGQQCGEHTVQAPLVAPALVVSAVGQPVVVAVDAVVADELDTQGPHSSVSTGRCW
ncbi:MAG: hypothetical protein GY708_10210 [Actinomycetia bacterium]|nr:hypothetical protein [Actinomycetes bacterium]